MFRLPYYLTPGSFINLSSPLAHSHPHSPNAHRVPGRSTLLGLRRSLVTGQPTSSQLTPNVLVALLELYYDLPPVCERAAQRGVKIITDAEYRFDYPSPFHRAESHSNFTAGTRYDSRLGSIDAVRADYFSRG